MICPIWKDLFHKSLEWLQVHKTTVLWCLWCRWFCDMRDDEETTWIEKWATLLNTSKHEFLKKKTTFAIHHHPITIIIFLINIMHIKTYYAHSHTKHTKTAVNEEWKIDLTAFSISYSHFWTIRTPQEKIKMHKKMTKKDEAQRSSITHTYAQTWKPRLRLMMMLMMIVQITNFEWLYAMLCVPYNKKKYTTTLFTL